MPNVDLLELHGIGIPPYSIRGATQTIEPIEQAKQVFRDINGTLLDLSQSQFQKFRATISCADQQPPAFGEAWPGLQVVVWSVAELAIEGSTGSSGLSRPAVSGSIREANGFTFWRPVLTMRITNFSEAGDPYKADYNWTLELEEI